MNKDYKDFNTYQKRAFETAVYPYKGANYKHAYFELASEVGEVADLIKRIDRDLDGEITDQTYSDLQKELGDVLWGLAALVSEFGMSFSDIADINIAKLADRAKRGTLHGTGNNR